MRLDFEGTNWYEVGCVRSRSRYVMEEAEMYLISWIWTSVVRTSRIREEYGIKMELVSYTRWSSVLRIIFFNLRDRQLCPARCRTSIVEVSDRLSVKNLMMKADDLRPRLQDECPTLSELNGNWSNGDFSFPCLPDDSKSLKIEFQDFDEKGYRVSYVVVYN